MSTWRIDKKGISLNEGGKWITFSFIKLVDDEKGRWFEKGQWLFRIWVKLPFSNHVRVMEAVITNRKIDYS